MGVGTVSDDEELVGLYDLLESASVVRETARKAKMAGAYEPWIGKPKGGKRLEVPKSALQGLLDATWDFVLYERSTLDSEQCGPWVPADRVAAWLRTKLKTIDDGADGCTGTYDRTEFAVLTGLSPRRIWEWMEKSQWVSYRTLEDALWAYGGMYPEAICPRSEMTISRQQDKGSKAS